MFLQCAPHLIVQSGKASLKPVELHQYPPSGNPVLNVLYLWRAIAISCDRGMIYMYFQKWSAISSSSLRIKSNKLIESLPEEVIRNQDLQE